MKVYTYVIIAVGLTILLHFAGLNSTDNAVFRITGVGFEENTSAPDYGAVTSANVSASGFFNILFGSGSLNGILLALIASGGAILVGLYTRGISFETVIIIPFITGTLILFLETFTNLMAYSIGTGSDLVSAVTILIFVPLSAGFIISMVEFIRGSD